MAYIVQNGRIVAKVDGAFSPVNNVRFSSQRTQEAVDAARDWSLVNASSGRLAQGRTWDAKWAGMDGEACRYAEQLSDGEFYIK